jgi:catechol 2,3-dioxygenase-like lactoylglutathione lyase family enzyme
LVAHLSGVRHRRCRRRTTPCQTDAVRIRLVTVVVDEYDPAIEFFVNALGFELVEDSPAETADGRRKRWVVVRPSGAETGILLARADGERQVASVGNQTGGRVSLFLQVDDFWLRLPAYDLGRRALCYAAPT